jgi:hypothetical protein
MRSDSGLDTILAAGQVQVVEILTLRVVRGWISEVAVTPDTVFSPTREIYDTFTWATRSYQALPVISILDFGDIPECAGQEIASVTAELSNESVLMTKSAAGATFSTTLQELARLGLLDGAEIKLETAWSATGPFAPSLPADHKKTTEFLGFVERALPNPGGVVLEAKSWPGKLGASSVPRNLVSPYCRFDVFSANCGKTATALNATRDCFIDETHSTKTVVRVLAATLDPLTLDMARLGQGRIEMTKGRNLGVSRTIESVVGSGLDLGGLYYLDLALAPPGLPWTPESGEEAWVWMGCNKTIEACRDTFANKERFGGFPFVPAPESI